MGNKIEWSGEGVDELSDTQQDILEVVVENPDMSNAEIAVEADCSESWVRETRNQYEDRLEIEDDDSGSFFIVLMLVLFALIAAQQAGLF